MNVFDLNGRYIPIKKENLLEYFQSLPDEELYDHLDANPKAKKYLITEMGLAQGISNFLKFSLGKEKDSYTVLDSPKAFKYLQRVKNEISLRTKPKIEPTFFSILKSEMEIPTSDWYNIKKDEQERILNAVSYLDKNWNNLVKKYKEK